MPVDLSRKQGFALVTLHVYLDDHGVCLDAIEDLPGGDGHSGGPYHLLPLLFPCVETLLGDQVCGARHVLVLRLGQRFMNQIIFKSETLP